MFYDVVAMIEGSGWIVEVTDSGAVLMKVLVVVDGGD